MGEGGLKSSLSSTGGSLRLLTDFVKDVFTSEVEIQQSENSARDALLLEFPMYFSQTEKKC